MGKVQVVIHVQSRLPPPAEQDDRLPVCYDSLCMLRVCGNGSSIRSVKTSWTQFTPRLTALSREQTMSRSRTLSRRYIAPPKSTTTTLWVLRPTTSSLAFMSLRYLDRGSSSIYSGPRDMRASPSDLPGSSAVCSHVSCASRTLWLSRSLWPCTVQPSQRTVRTSWLSRRWLSTHHSVGRSYVSSDPEAPAHTVGTVYKHNARAIASVALLWPGWVRVRPFSPVVY
jgi:hypothetical protein